jgi:hypothetical protein
MLVVMAVVTTLATTPVLQLLERGARRRAREATREADFVDP